MTGGQFMVMMIILIVFVGSGFQSWMKTRRVESESRKDSGREGELLARIEGLEKRIEILERINTDPSERLKRDIDAL